MGETIVVNMGEVKEKPVLAKGVYTFTFKDSKAFLVRSKNKSDWIGLQGIIVPEGFPDDAFTIWLAANKTMTSGIDTKKFLRGLGFTVEGATAVQLGGELAVPGEDGKVNAATAPQAQLQIEGRPPFPVGFLKFRGETILETNKDDGRQQPRLNSVLGRVA